MIGVHLNTKRRHCRLTLTLGFTQGVTLGTKLFLIYIVNKPLVCIIFFENYTSIYEHSNIYYNYFDI